MSTGSSAPGILWLLYKATLLISVLEYSAFSYFLHFIYCDCCYLTEQQVDFRFAFRVKSIGANTAKSVVEKYLSQEM